MEKERIINIERWDYALSRNGDRLKKLKAAPSFPKITEEIKREMKVLCFHPDYLHNNDRDDKLYDRPVYCIEVGEKLFDWFFNSENGYRAAYFRSPTEGLNANQHFIESLRPALLKSDKTSPIYDKKFIEESLKSPSAKAWLVEEKHYSDREGGTCNKCSGEWNHPQNKIAEISNNRWEKLDDKKGCKAPYLTKIRIMGAFLNDNYDEYIPSSKRFRAKDINEGGWS